MLNVIKRLFGERNQRDISQFQPLVDEINDYAERFQHLTDDELKAKTAEFKARLREAVAEVEREQEEIRLRLRATAESEGPAGGDGQAAPEGVLSHSERQLLVEQLDDLDGEWLDRVEFMLDELLPEAFAV